MASLAKLQVSTCGRFALLFNSTGEYFLVWSKPLARHMVECGIDFEVITDEDARMLLSEIAASPLPDTDDSVSVLVKMVVTNLNSMHTYIPEFVIDEGMILRTIAFFEAELKQTVH